jgi:hypothetical protein
VPFGRSTAVAVVSAVGLAGCGGSAHVGASRCGAYVTNYGTVARFVGPHASDYCASFIAAQNRGSSGLFWTTKPQQIHSYLERQRVCTLRRGDDRVTVSDTGAIPFGDQVCAALDAAGWT